ncbi:hypothetical protein [Enterococcus sp. AD013-P3]|uniref:hypothetical protein n=1 Tax=Enterococcus sp. AD013-P3 TaxID=3411036 RepID=UPI003B92EB43
MKRKHRRISALLGVFIIGFSQISPLSPLAYVAVGESSSNRLNQFQSPELRAVLNYQGTAEDSTEAAWRLTLDNVTKGLEELNFQIKDSQGTLITKIKINEILIEANSEGYFSIEAKDTKIEITSELNHDLTVEFFKLSSGKKDFWGLVKASDSTENHSSLPSEESQEGADTSNIVNEGAAASLESFSEGGSEQNKETIPSSEIAPTSSLENETTSTNSNNLQSDVEKSDQITSSSVEKEQQKEKVAQKVASPLLRSTAAPTGITGNPNIPKGAILLDGVFGKINSVGTNDGSGVSKVNNPKENNGIPYSKITLKGSNNWLSIWTEDQYRMDFSKTFHGRTYINFGTSKADGLAFVMQNAGKKVLTSANTGNDGQNLGVYGGTGAWRESIFSSWITPETYAIKKSVAIEFDLNPNNDAQGHVYDKDNPQTPHMAYSFPSNLDRGYRPDGNSWDNWLSTKGANAKVQHYSSRLLNGVVGDNIQDGTWYEFRYDFDQSKKEFSYYLKNPVTNAQTEPVKIPWPDLQRELDLTNNNMKAYWGFTGANGALGGTVEFVFTQVPVDLSAKIMSDVQSSGKSIVDAEDHETYVPQLPIANKEGKEESLTLQTRFTVDNGEAAIEIAKWTSFVSPTQLDLTKASKNVVAQIGSNKYTGVADVDQKTGEIQITFQNLKVSPGETVTMSYELMTKKLDSTQKAYFSSRVTTQEVGTIIPNDFLSKQVAFWIKGNQAPVLEALSTEKAEFTDLDSFQYKFNYKDADSDELTYKVSLNGKELVNKKLQSSASNQTQVEKDVMIDLLAAEPSFRLGENTLTVTLNDDFNTAVSQEVKFNIVGYLGFEKLTKAYSWRYSRTALEAVNTPMAREAPMVLKIRDTRNKEINKNVKVSLEAKSLTNGVLNANERFVFNGKELGEFEIPVNQEVSYGKDEGLLLKLGNQDESGTFEGTLTWTIIDAP